MTLPIDALENTVKERLANRHLVVAASTGSGKSTRLPLWAARQGRVLVVEPRRVACTALAGYLAEQAGERVGESVGYAIRFDSAYSDKSRVLFVTPGIALRWLSESGLDDFATVMLDEFHERRWDTDLLLALLQHRGGHRLLVTSATLDGPRLARYLGGELLEAQGRVHPVEERYRARESQQMPDPRHLESRVASAVEEALAETEGDLLVFLPGRREIQQCHDRLKGLEVERVRLHAGVDNAEQRRALNPGQRRRVILATNVAETSLTVPGVTAVVDSGLERRTLRRNGRTVLSLEAVARSSADQRRGRAGRTAPGLALRLWGQHAPLETHRPPEIQREDLTELVLAAACAGVPVESLRFPNPLPRPSLDQARQRLARMRALDGAGGITEHGQQLFGLPTEPFFAQLITAMPTEAARGFMVDLAAALGAGQRWLTLPDSEQGRQALQAWQPVPCDATTLVAALREKPPEPVRYSASGRETARRLALAMRRQLGMPEPPAETEPLDAEAQRAVLEALPELAFVRRAGQRRRDRMGNGGTEVILAQDSRLAESAEAALVFDSHSLPGKGTRQTLTLATCLSPLPLERLVETGLARPEWEAPQWDGERLQALQRWLYAGRVIHEVESEPEGAAAREALARLIQNGRLLAPAGERLKADREAWNLYLALGQGDGEPVEDEAAWLEERLAALGVETGEDVLLLEPEDLAFEGIPAWERERFDEYYPRRVSLPDLDLQVRYKPALREVEVIHEGGNRKGDPKRWELPAWPGWRVRYRRASRVVDVR